MANAAIFNALMRPVRSVDDYLTQYENRDAQKAQIQQNALAAMQNQQLREAQIGEIRTRQQQAIAEQQAKQQQEAARRAALLRAGPVTGIQANAASGMTGPTPQAAAAIGQRRQINASELLAAGVPIEQIRLLAEADTLGMPEVARVLDTIGADRMPVQRREDKFGRPIGDPLAKPVKMELEDFGGTKQAINPYALQPGQMFTKTQSPDSVASVGASYANANATRAVAEATRDAAKITARAKDETDLRKEFADLPEVKKYKNAIPAYQAVVKAAQTNNPQADINLIYGLAKLYDPDSVVREGEYDTIANSQSIPEWLKGQAQRLAGGGKLTTETKRQIIEQASIRLQGYQSEVEGARRGYGQIASGRGLDPANVFPPVGEQVKPGSGLTEAEKAELEELRKKLGRK